MFDGNTFDIIEKLKEAGIPVTVVKPNLSPGMKAWLKQTEKDVKEYVMKIEEAHKKAAESTLHFGSKIEALDNPVPFSFGRG